MRYVIDHDYHIHSKLSSCSNDPRQTTEAILQYALKNGLKKICLTDHYWDREVEGASNWYKPQDFEHLTKALPLPRNTECEFLFGCETDMDRFFQVGIPKERFENFDFIIVPTTHLHMKGFTYLAEDGDAVEKKAKLFLDRFDAFLNLDLPFHKVGLAHITCALIMREEDQYLQVLEAISDEEYAKRFQRMAQLGCGLELNIGLGELMDERVKEIVCRPYKIAKAQGCKFYLGSDAHHPGDLNDALERFERMIDMLELTEEDKFYF